jgi:hypothetical protein
MRTHSAKSPNRQANPEQKDRHGTHKLLAALKESRFLEGAGRKNPLTIPKKCSCV